MNGLTKIGTAKQLAHEAKQIVDTIDLDRTWGDAGAEARKEARRACAERIRAYLAEIERRDA